MPEAVQILDPDRSWARGPSKTDFHVSTKYESLSGFFVDTVTGEFDQDISFLLVGNKGRGKSWTALSIGYHCGVKLVDHFGGQVTDYFDVDRTVATIDEEAAHTLMMDETKHLVKIFDDIGIGWGARDWRSKENIEMADVFQVNRVDSQIQMFTIPHQFLLDKIPRSLVSHYGVMDKRWFGKGYTSLKLFQPETIFKENIIINPYLQANRQKYVVYVIPKPPSEITTKYRELRKKMKELAVKRRREGQPEKDDKGKPVPEHPMKRLQEKNFAEIRALYAPHLDEMKQEIKQVGFKKGVINITRRYGLMDVIRARRYLETRLFDEMVNPPREKKKE